MPTTNLELPIFTSTDKPSWLGSWNSAMNKIDTAIGLVQGTVEGLPAQITAVDTKATSAQSSAASAQSDATSALGASTQNATAISSLQQRVTTLENKGSGGMAYPIVHISNWNNIGNTGLCGYVMVEKTKVEIYVSDVNISTQNIATEDTTIPYCAFGFCQENPFNLNGVAFPGTHSPMEFDLGFFDNKIFALYNSALNITIFFSRENGSRLPKADQDFYALSLREIDISNGESKTFTACPQFIIQSLFAPFSY